MKWPGLFRILAVALVIGALALAAHVYTLSTPKAAADSECDPGLMSRKGNPG